MSFESALEAWVRQHAAWSIPDGATELSGFNVEHHAGFTTDSGTGFPEDIDVTYYATMPGGRRKKVTCGPDTGNMVEFMRELTEVES